MKTATCLLHFSLAITILMVMSCSPKVEDASHAPLIMPLGSRFQDSLITDFADAEFTSENVIKEVDTKSRLKQIEAMADIAVQPNKADWKKKTLDHFQNPAEKFSSMQLDSSQSSYLNLVYAHIRADVNSSIGDVDKRISKDTDKVVAFVREKQNKMLPMTLESSLKEKLIWAELFLKSLTADIKKMNLLPEFKSTFVTELDLQREQLLTPSFQLEESLARAETLESCLISIALFLEKTSTQLTAEDQANLAKAMELSTVVRNMNDAPTGLQALALVWTLLDENQREASFKESSPDLYAFLVDKSADDIHCLTEKNCRGIKTKIVLSLGVYPAIKKFGVQNIAALINQKGHAYIMTKANEIAFIQLQKSGEIITDKILQSVAKKKIEIGDFKDHLRENLSTGFDQLFNNIKDNSLNTWLVDSQNSILDLETQTIFLRNKIKTLSWLNKSKQLNRTQFEIIENLMSLPVFSKSPSHNLMLLQNDVVDLISNPEPRQYLDSLGSTSTEIKLKNQTAMLLTTSLALRELTDWKQTSFDEGLSKIQADQILTQFKSKSLAQPFFAKKDLLAIVLSVAGQTLKLLQSEYSPLILVNNQNELIPIQKLADENVGPIALAAATDFKLGKRVQEVRTADLSEFMMSLIQFYSATQGIEQTQSERLKHTDKENSSLLNQLIDARSTLKKLIIANANFISNQLIQSNGLVSKSISLSENLKAMQKYNLTDQTKAIEALVRAYEITDIDVYLWTAQDIYYSMNRSLYSSKMKFYQLNTTNQIQSGIDYTTVLETYKSLLKLKPYLNYKGQLQFENIYAAWLN